MFISNLAFLDVVSQETVVGGGSNSHNGGGWKPPTKPTYNRCFKCFEGEAYAEAFADIVGMGGVTSTITGALVNKDEETVSSYSFSSAASA